MMERFRITSIREAQLPTGRKGRDGYPITQPGYMFTLSALSTPAIMFLTPGELRVCSLTPRQIGEEIEITID